MISPEEKSRLQLVSGVILTMISGFVILVSARCLYLEFPEVNVRTYASTTLIFIVIRGLMWRLGR